MDDTFAELLKSFQIQSESREVTPEEERFPRWVPVRSPNKLLIWPRFYKELFRRFLERLDGQEAYGVLLKAVRDLRDDYESLEKRLGEDPFVDMRIKDIEGQMNQFCGRVSCCFRRIRRAPPRFYGSITIEHGKQTFEEAMKFRSPYKPKKERKTFMKVYPQYKISFELNSKSIFEVDPLDIICHSCSKVDLEFSDTVIIAVQFRWKGPLWKKTSEANHSHEVGPSVETLTTEP